MKHRKLATTSRFIFRPLALAVAVTTCPLLHAEDLAITGATLFTAEGDAPFTATLVIDEGRIAAIARDGSVPADTPVLDATGLGLLPGFFDLHTHFTPNGEPATAPQIAWEYVASGVTSVLDFHEAPEAFAPRREWMMDVPSPNIGFIARMSTPNGHGADWSDTTTTKWVNTPFAAVQAVKEVQPYMPDGIKVFTDGWRYGSGIDNTSMDEPTLTALVGQAHEYGLPVLTHTVTVDRAGIAARAGVNVIAHSILDAHLSEATIADMLASGTAYAATLAVYEADKPGREPGTPERRARFQVGLDNVKALQDAGALVVLGTDAGMPATPHGVSSLHEMELMVQAGLTAEQALLAGTANSAKAIGQLDTRGTLAVGKMADLVLIDGTPWEEITDVRNTVYTFVAGKQMFGPGGPQPSHHTTMHPLQISEALVDDFESGSERTSRDTLRTTDPDGGLERSWQIIQTVPEAGRGTILHLSAQLALRETAQAGVILPLNRGGVQPADVTSFTGIGFDLKGDGGPYMLSVTTTSGKWTAPLHADGQWGTMQVPFATLAPDKGEQEWTGEDLLDVRFLIRRPGGKEAWLELDDVTFY